MANRLRFRSAAKGVLFYPVGSMEALSDKFIIRPDETAMISMFPEIDAPPVPIAVSLIHWKDSDTSLNEMKVFGGPLIEPTPVEFYMRFEVIAVRRVGCG